MCGISVLLDRAVSADSAARLLRMHEPTRHRGPDGEGFLRVDRHGRWERTDSAQAFAPAPGLILGMAARRLKILDLTEAGAQPMASPDGSLWIVFNGERRSRPRPAHEDRGGIGRPAPDRGPGRALTARHRRTPVLRATPPRPHPDHGLGPGATAAWLPAAGPGIGQVHARGRGRA